MPKSVSSKKKIRANKRHRQQARRELSRAKRAVDPHHDLAHLGSWPSLGLNAV